METHSVGLSLEALPHAHDSDERLMERLRHDDAVALDTIMQRYWSPLINYSMKFVSTVDAAEEVAQETWLGVLKGLDRFEGRSSLKTWLFGILTNIGTMLTERADTRAWHLLPGSISLVRLRLPAGTHDLTVEDFTRCRKQVRAIEGEVRRGLLLGAVSGALLDAVVLRRFARAPRLIATVATIGLAHDLWHGVRPR